MQISSIIGHAAQCSSIILKSTKPADTVVSEYTRERKYLGSTDRRILSELVFMYFRNRTIVEELAQSRFTLHNNTALKTNLDKLFLLVTYILFFHSREDTLQVTIDTLLRFFEISEDIALEFHSTILSKHSQMSNFTTIDEVSTFYSMPMWILECFQANMLVNRSYTDCSDLAKSTTIPAPLCIRVNTRITTSNDVLQRLHHAGIEARFSEFVPNCIVINQRVSLLETTLYKSGAIEVQDESSQLAAFALAPEEDWDILDACAGAGGKTLHMATLQNDSGRIVSSDIEWNRLKQIQKRNERHRFTSISTHLWGNKKQKLSISQFDGILIDTPCSGLGTIRRMPLQKWKLSKDSITKLAKNQLEILETYSSFVKPNGIVVYATCSFLPQENEEVVHKFLEKHPEFSPDSLIPGFSKFAVTMKPDSDFCTTMLPSVHGSDGFFVARLRKNG
jgi:16S rRNA (cytosine967-C5)-methyltransferase